MSGNKSNAYWISLILLLCFLPFISCSKIDNHTPVVIGINTWAGYDPFILAESKNLFEKNNIQVEIRRFGSTQEEMQAMRDGILQGAALTLDEAVLLHESGCKVKAVLVIDYSLGGDMVIGQKGMADMHNLKGKKIGHEGSLVGKFLLHRALHTNKMKENDIEMIAIKPENWLSAFREHTIDALVCFNPISTALLNIHEGNLLFSSKEIPFEIIDILVFSKPFFNSNKIAVVNVVKTWFDTLEYINSNLDEAAETIASEKQITEEEYKQGLSGFATHDLDANKAVFDMKSEDNIYKYSQVIIDFMLSEGWLSGRVNTDDFFEPSVFDELCN